MIRGAHVVIWVLLLFFLSGCLTAPPPSPSAASLQGPLPDYQASGRILLQHAESKNSGEVLLRFSKNTELQIQIFVPLLGSLLYEIRANARHFLILDYQQQLYTLTKNNRENRIRWLGVDLNLEEFQKILWGREVNLSVSGLKNVRVESSGCHNLEGHCPPKKIKIRVPELQTRLVMAFREIHIPEKQIPPLSFVAPEEMSPVL